MIIYDLIFVSMENWDEIWRRNQFICSGLAKRYPKSKILFVAPPRDYLHNLLKGKFLTLLERSAWVVPEFPNITVIRPPKFLPNSVAWARTINEIIERAYVRSFARRLGIKRPILWLNPHYAVHMVDRMGERTIIYDITDDWTAHNQSAMLRELTIAQDAKLCRCANAVIVCSQELLDRKKNLSNNIYLVPNGVDAEHYRCILDGIGPLPEKTVQWPKPVLGYTGTLHPERLDIDLIESIARRLSCGSLVFIGPNMLPKKDEIKLRNLKNLFILNATSYFQLPEYMRAFDCCIVPHKISPYTESLNPLKSWEYLAAGKPIVSTKVAGFRDYPEHVYLASNVEDFLAGIRKALDENPSKKEARRAEAERNSWVTRISQIETIITSI